MFIGTGYGQANFIFAGGDFPTGAQVTLGIFHANNTLDQETQATNIAAQFAISLADWWGIEQDNTTVLWKWGPNETGPAVEVPGAGLGTLTQTGNTPAVCALVRKNTARGGRKGRGRIFWPCPNAENIGDGGQLQSAYVSGLTAAWEDFRVGLTAGDLVPVLLHDDDGTTSEDEITSFSCQTTVATQRRRQRR